MEVLERKIRVSSIIKPVKQQETLTYEIIQQRKREQQRLIDAGIIKKPKLVWGFTAEERREFDNGISVEDFFDSITK